MGTKSAPFVFRDADRLPSAGPSDRDRSYDPERQLWIDDESGEAWVLRQAQLQQDARARTQYGETLITQTTEGSDKSEDALI